MLLWEGSCSRSHQFAEVLPVKGNLLSYWVEAFPAGMIRIARPPGTVLGKSLFTYFYILMATVSHLFPNMSCLVPLV